ncbi:tripartite tricarboxylate transporter TctB family protein [bacterium]|nr:tripartite tricarboxylate transporter TctB family protein [bacterium]
MIAVAPLAERAWLSLTLLLSGCALYASTLGASYADLGGAFSPVFFPRIILSGWILLSMLSMLADVLRAENTVSVRWRVIVVVTCALFAYIKLISILGFFFSSFLFSIILLAATGQRKWLDILLFSLIVPGSLVALFNHVLTMPLPVSPFFWWL